MDLVHPTPFSAADFAARARAQTSLGDMDDYGDHLLNQDIIELFPDKGLREAAVLIPVIDRGSEATVLLTKRTEGLRAHPGQIAFPGGRVDPTDVSIEHAALREANEEVGLDSSFVEVVGQLPSYRSGTGFRVTPVLGVVDPDFTITINPDEVDTTFEVPLGFLMNPANHQVDSRVWDEKRRFFYRMPYNDWMIWGLTAGIIRMLYDRLYA